MSEPKLTVLGVYKPQISAEVWQEQLESTGGHTQAHFDGLVLIEALVEGVEEPFDIAEIGQLISEGPDDPGCMQVPYEEALLSADGETAVAHGFDWESRKERGTFRFAFYLHFYDPARPLRTPVGEVDCPVVQDVPVRLMMLMPYTACS